MKQYSLYWTTFTYRSKKEKEHMFMREQYYVFVSCKWNTMLPVNGTIKYICGIFLKLSNVRILSFQFFFFRKEQVSYWNEIYVLVYSISVMSFRERATVVGVSKKAYPLISALGFLLEVSRYHFSASDYTWVDGLQGKH